MFMSPRNLKGCVFFFAVGCVGKVLTSTLRWKKNPKKVNSKGQKNFFKNFFAKKCSKKRKQRTYLLKLRNRHLRVMHSLRYTNCWIYHPLRYDTNQMHPTCAKNGLRMCPDISKCATPQWSYSHDFLHRRRIGELPRIFSSDLNIRGCLPEYARPSTNQTDHAKSHPDHATASRLGYGMATNFH